MLHTLRYGDADGQEGDLHLPAAPRPPVVCLLHGGFWRMPYGRGQLDAIARDLAARGVAVWNLGYRRVGAPGGGFPGTLLDVDAGLDVLSNMAAAGVDLDLSRVVVAGHSAGGQLALWSAARQRSALAGLSARVLPVAVAGLAPVCDLRAAHAPCVGGGAVEAFLGGGPSQVPARYAAASPMALLPLGVRQLIIHGARDDALPVGMSQTYTAAARAAGDAVDLVELPDAGHMDFVDPSSAAFACFRSWLDRLLG